MPVVDEGIDDAGDREHAPPNGAHAREEVQEGGLLLVVDHLERRDVVEEEDPWQPVGVDLLQDAPFSVTENWFVRMRFPERLVYDVGAPR